MLQQRAVGEEEDTAPLHGFDWVLGREGAAARFAAWRVRRIAQEGVPPSLLGPLGAWPVPFEGSSEVRTDANLVCFRAFIATAPRHLALQWCQLPLTLHRASGILLAGSRSALSVHVREGDGFECRFIRERECTQLPCTRCTEGRGGYVWRWVGPWTPTAAILSASHGELWRHWPYGACGTYDRPIQWPRPGAYYA